MEASIVPGSGFDFHGVSAGKWNRQAPDPRQALKALRGLIAAWQLLKQLRPDLVVGFGGFASFPACFASALLKLPLVLHEGNAFPGRVTRWFAGRALGVLTSQAEAASKLQHAKRLESVGFPIREQRLPKDVARRELGLPQSGTVTLVLGGSQGSLTLNREVPLAYQALQQELGAELGTVLHCTGTRWLESVRASLPADERYHLAGYVEATLAWSAADLAITRAGVSTLAEAAFHGVPLIMVPLPSAAENHQRHNALAVEAAAAGTMVEEAQLAELPRVWREFLDPEVRMSAAYAARARSPEGASEQILDLFDSLLTSDVHASTAGKGVL
jgi:UDP-N-acetylglucosamine--N-acetylmuramyl-(pentapeptide) pyrophosphoryl-undecaprenol N-acetylglucosamine transferase